MAEREATYWWHVGRLKIIDTKLAKHAGKKKDLKILNIGCGTGGTIAMLEKYGIVDNVDVSDDAIAFMKKKGYSNAVKVNGTELPFDKGTYDFVVAFDVLEHIANDVEALKEWHRVLKPSGKIIVTVPAYQWLWSGHDVSLHHHRRYISRELAQKAKQAGLRKGSLSYAIVFSLPLVAGFRTLNKLRKREMDSETSYVDLPEIINKMFTRLLFIEATMHKFIRFPFGTSIIASFIKHNDPGTESLEN